MLLRTTAEDWGTVAHYLGRVLLMASGATVLPLLWALAGREWGPASSLVLTAGAFALAGALASARRRADSRLDWSHGLVVAALAWLIVPAIGSLPLALSGHFADPLDAYFEAVSGLTTTGLSLAQDLDHLAPSLNLWRHLLQFMGGQAIVLGAITVFADRAGLFSFHAEGREERILPSVASSTRFLSWVSATYLVVGVTVLGAVAYFTLGLGPGRSAFHGLLVFLSAFSTGGFAPQSTSIGYYHSALFEAAVAVFMLAGATSIGVHYVLWRGRRRSHLLHNLETKAVGFTALATLTLTLIGLGTLGIYTGVGALTRQGLFQVISAHTTTGFTTVPATELAGWGGLAFGGIAIAMALGGMTASAAGGVKSLRVGLTLKVLKDQIRALLLPDRAVISQAYYQSGRRRLTPQLAQRVLSLSLLFVALYLVGAGVALAYGYPLQAALAESVSAATTTGLSVGVTSPSMPIALEVTYILQMWLGRLEFVAVFALFGFVAAAVRGR
jgi:trk system potassium uptake protein TrkH